MGNWTWAQLSLGGKAPRHALAAALRIHENEALSVDDRGAIVTGGDADRGLFYDESAAVLILTGEPNYGMFHDLEQRLQELRVAYDRVNDDTGESGKSLARYRPDVGLFEHPEEGGDILVPASKVRQQLSEGGADGLRQWLDAEYPDIPALEPLELIEEWPLACSRIAREQGWDVVNDHDELAIQRVADARRFFTDEEAQAFVRARAEHGDPIAVRALAIHSGSFPLPELPPLSEEAPQA